LGQADVEEVNVIVAPVAPGDTGLALRLGAEHGVTFSVYAITEEAAS
jgi:hypothetical protein